MSDEDVNLIGIDRETAKSLSENNIHFEITTSGCFGSVRRIFGSEETLTFEIVDRIGLGEEGFVFRVREVHTTVEYLLKVYNDQEGIPNVDEGNQRLSRLKYICEKDLSTTAQVANSESSSEDLNWYAGVPLLGFCHALGSSLSGRDRYLCYLMKHAGSMTWKALKCRRLLKEHERFQLARHLAKAVFFLEKSGIRHCDISAENVVVQAASDSSMSLALIDFDLFFTQDQELECHNNQIGHDGYKPPQEFSPKNCEYDRFSMGIMIFEILCQFKIFESSDSSYFTQNQLNILEPNKIPDFLILAETLPALSDPLQNLVLRVVQSDSTRWPEPIEWLEELQEKSVSTKVNWLWIAVVVVVIGLIYLMFNLNNKSTIQPEQTPVTTNQKIVTNVSIPSVLLKNTFEDFMSSLSIKDWEKVKAYHSIEAWEKNTNIRELENEARYTKFYAKAVASQGNGLSGHQDGVNQTTRLEVYGIEKDPNLPISMAFYWDLALTWKLVEMTPSIVASKKNYDPLQNQSLPNKPLDLGEDVQLDSFDKFKEFMRKE